MKLVPKKQTAWGTLEYKGPQYYELKEKIRKEDPALYNKLEQEYAAQQHPTSEFIIWKDSNGQVRRTPQVIGMSGADPIGQLYVEGVALNPVFKGLGRVAEYGLAKAGNNWARAKILSKVIDSKASTYLNHSPVTYKQMSSKLLPKDQDLLYHQNYGTSRLTNKGLIPGKSSNSEDYLWWKEGSQYGNFPERNVYTIPRNKAKVATRGSIDGIRPDGDYPLTKEVPLEELTEYSINPVTYGFEKRMFIKPNKPPKRLIMDDKTIPAYFGKNNILASIYDNPDQYKGRISDRVINYIKQRKEVGKSLGDSRDFIQSAAVKNSKETNQKIADRLGLPRQAEYDLQHKPVIYHYKFGQKNYNLKGVSPDNVGGYYDRTEQTINLRDNYHNLQAAKSIPFHENLHAQGYGSSAVNDWKIQYLIDKDKVMNMSKRDKDYFLSSEELPVHTATLGKSWGVKPGQSYPGDKAFDEMLYNNGISGASYYLKYDTPKDKRRFWRTLNGTMFGLSPLIILNKNEQFSN